MTSDVSTQSPYALLVTLERRLQAADGGPQAVRTWAGLGFRLRDQLFVAPRADVLEVLQPPRMTRVPNAPEWMRGVANVRGALYPVIDLGRLFGQEAFVGSSDSRLLLLNAETDPVAFLVDGVFGYRNFEAGDQRVNALEEADKVVAPFLLGGFVRDGQPWMALSLHRAAEAGLDDQTMAGAAA